MPRAHYLMFFAGLALPALAQNPTTRHPPPHHPTPQHPTPRHPPPPASDRLLVCNQAEDTPAIIAVSERRELAVLKTGSGPHEVAVAPNGRTAVVTNYGNHEPGHTLTIIEVTSARVRSTVDLTPPGADDQRYLRPSGVRFVSDEQVLVTSETARTLLRVNIQTGDVEEAWLTQQPAMHMVAASRNEAVAAATSLTDGTVAFFDLRASHHQPHRPIKIGGRAEGVALHPITADAWVCDRNNNTLSIVSPKTGKVEATLETGSQPFRVVFTPDGKHVLVTCTDSGELQIFDAEERTLVREVSMHGDRSEHSSMPRAVACGPDQRYAYVACSRGEFVAVVDLEAGEYIDRIDTRRGPDGIAYARPAATPKASEAELRR